MAGEASRTSLGAFLLGNARVEARTWRLRRRSNRGRHGADLHNLSRMSDELGSLGASVRREAALGGDE